MQGPGGPYLLKSDVFLFCFPQKITLLTMQVGEGTSRSPMFVLEIQAISQCQNQYGAFPSLSLWSAVQDLHGHRADWLLVESGCCFFQASVVSPVSQQLSRASAWDLSQPCLVVLPQTNPGASACAWSSFTNWPVSQQWCYSQQCVCVWRMFFWLKLHWACVWKVGK